jgi:hypothetical protein
MDRINRMELAGCDSGHRPFHRAMFRPEIVAMA